MSQAPATTAPPADTTPAPPEPAPAAPDPRAELEAKLPKLFADAITVVDGCLNGTLPDDGRTRIKLEAAIGLLTAAGRFL